MARSQSFATPRRLAVRVKRLAAAGRDQQVQRRGPPVSAAFDASGAADARGAGLRAQLRRRSSRELGRENDPKGNEYLSFTGVKAGARSARRCCRRWSAKRSTRCPSRSACAGAPARRSSCGRCTGWCCCYGARSCRPRVLDATSRQRDARPSLPCTEAAAHRSPGQLRAHAARSAASVVADFRRAPRAHPRAASSRWRPELGGTRADRAMRCWMKSRRWSNGRCRWPGSFEERFLALPREVLISTLQDHQRYFPVEAADGQPAALVHHRQQHREPRPGRGARRQRTRGATAPGRCRLLLGAGSQAAAGSARCRSWMR